MINLYNLLLSYGFLYILVNIIGLVILIPFLIRIFRIDHCQFINKIDLKECDDSIKQQVADYLSELLDYCIVHNSYTCVKKRNAQSRLRSLVEQMRNFIREF